MHGIFDAATELQPLIEMLGARAYGAADGVTTKELAEVKLRALQSARAAQQWRDARPPPGYRTYTFRNGMRVPVVWLLKVPLYGEVDAGYIWNHTATHQLCDVQKWSQSEHDPATSGKSSTMARSWTSCSTSTMPM